MKIMGLSQTCCSALFCSYSTPSAGSSLSCYPFLYLPLSHLTLFHSTTLEAFRSPWWWRLIRALAMKVPVSRFIACRMCWIATANSLHHVVAKSAAFSRDSASQSGFGGRSATYRPCRCKIHFGSELRCLWSELKDQSLECRVPWSLGTWPVEQYCGVGKYHKGHFHCWRWELHGCHPRMYTSKEEDRCGSLFGELRSPTSSMFFFLQ